MMKNHILCDVDIKYLAGRLNERSAKILNCLYTHEGILEQNKIIRVSELTRTVATNELIRLEGAGFINTTSGSCRRTIYSLTPSGYRLFEIKK